MRLPRTRISFLLCLPWVAALLSSAQSHERSRGRAATAGEVARALNSVKFMDHLARGKNTADVRTYQRGGAVGDEGRPSPSLAGVCFRGGGPDGPPASELRLGRPAIWEDRTGPDPRALCRDPGSPHETVTEYTGVLWFLPTRNRGVRFRETLRVLSISDDGASSTVECQTEYHDGSAWRVCSRVVCVLRSAGEGEGEDMAARTVLLDVRSELLVRLPMPRIATDAVGRRISSTFEAAAVEFISNSLEVMSPEGIRGDFH